MSLLDFFSKFKARKNDCKNGSVHSTNQQLSTDSISAEEYNRKREAERNYLESKYDFNSISGIESIPVSITENHPEYICGVTGGIEYYLLHKAGKYETEGNEELAIACYRKAIQIMPLRGDYFYKMDDYLRFPRYLRKVRRFDEARIEEDKIKKRFSMRNNGKSPLLDETIRNQLQLHNDYIQVSTNRICPFCSPYNSRVYSISGSDQRFPPLSSMPEFLTFNQCSTCRCFIGFYGFYPYCSSKLSDIIKQSNRPATDNRSAEERSYFADDLKKQQMDDLREAARQDYDWLWEFHPEICPKSFSGYMRMHNLNSEKFQAIVKVANENGRILK